MSDIRSDTIKRSDAIEAIEVVDWYHQNRNKDMVSGANSSEHQAWYKAEDVYDALKAIPSADRPQGEWITTTPWSYGCGMGEVYGYYQKCSNCGKEFMDKSNFCPNCGARMKGADDERP